MLFFFYLKILNLKKQEIYDKVEMMNGKTSRTFTEHVTRLITTEVGSAKYNVSKNLMKHRRYIYFKLTFIVRQQLRSTFPLCYRPGWMKFGV